MDPKPKQTRKNAGNSIMSLKIMAESRNYRAMRQGTLIQTNVQY